MNEEHGMYRENEKWVHSFGLFGTRESMFWLHKRQEIV